MTTATLEPIKDSARDELKPGAATTMRLAVVLGLITVAHLPLLVIHAVGLWQDPQYQFFPIVLAGAAILAWRGTRNLGTLVPGRRVASMILLGSSAALLLFAGLLISPLLGAIAAQLCILSAAYALGGFRMARAVFPAWLLLWLAIPPLGMDEWLVVRLQILASRCSSAVLDLIGIYHVPQGVVMQVDDRRMMVEEACSGIHSLVVIVSFTLFFVLWEKCSLARSIVLLSAAVFWVLLINTLRILVVTVAWTQWKINLLEGVKHDVLGLLGVLLTLGLLASTDQLYRVIVPLLRSFWVAQVQWVRKWRGRRSRKKSTSKSPAAETIGAKGADPRRLAAASDQLAPAISSPATRWELPEHSLLNNRAVAGAYGFLTLMLVVWLWPCLVAVLTPAPRLLMDGLAALGENDLPAKLGGYQRVKFDEEHRSASSNFGEFSRSWSFKSGKHRAVVSVDYPFLKWHELTNCYRNGGWSELGRLDRADEQGTLVEAAFSRPLGQQGSLIYSLIDRQGAVAPHVVAGPRSLLERLAVWRADTRQNLRDRFLKQRSWYYQVQLFVESDHPLNAAEREQAQQVYRDARKQLIERVEQSQSPSPARSEPSS